jgi:gliding motility-associated-like protein
VQKTDLITVYNIPKAMFTANPKETSLSNPLVNVVNQSVGAEEFLWRYGDGETSKLFEENHSYEDAGTYCIWLIAKNDFGCVDSTKECVEIKPNYTLFVPNSFTPNGDGFNSKWEIQYIEQFPEAEVKLYNRWGKLLFSQINYKNDFDFSLDGKELPSGTYFYQIDFGRNKPSQKGMLEIIR